MHKALVNRAQLELRLSPRTPLLVKAGNDAQPLLHPQFPDLMCVRTGGPDFETVYIPGASLKGVIRSAAERVLRSLDGSFACDPLDDQSRCHREASKHGEGKKPEDKQKAHSMLCLACRTFGSQALASRVVFRDAIPPPELRAPTNRTELRSGVAIDRKTGGAARRKRYDMECVTGGAFDTTIVLTNFELWQLAVVGTVLRHANDGLIRFGSAKSRGFGELSVTPLSLRVEQQGTGASLAGVGTLLSAELRQAYGFKESDLRVDAGGDVSASSLGRRLVWTTPDAVWKTLDRVADKCWPLLRGQAA